MEGFVIYLTSTIFVEKIVTNSKKEIPINRLEIESSINFVLFIELD